MIVICAGTRPEIIKMAPILIELENRRIDHLFVDTSQHYTYHMNRQFITQLGLHKPDVHLPHDGNECEVLYSIISNLHFELRNLSLNKKDVVMVEGDTTSALACALYASKNKIPVAHVEAGLRSYDSRMPEEYNRRLIDHLGTYCFAPTTLSRVNLERESVLGTIFVTGNTIIDALDLFLNKASTPNPKKPFILATFHRQENVDNPKVLRSFLDVCAKAPLPIIYPMHHRTRLRIEQNRFSVPENVTVVNALGYFDFLGLLRACRLVLTDSGGIQEEVTHPRIHKPCVVMRESTERQEAEMLGFTTIAGTDRNKVLDAINNYLHFPKALPMESPYGDGSAAKRIVDILTR